MNGLRVRPGTSFVVFGAGAVGLSAVMAARICGATTIIAADVVPSRLDTAKELGATHVVNSKETNPVEAVRQLTHGGAAFSLEATGNPAVLRQAIDSIGALGKCAIVGAAKLGARRASTSNDVMIPARRSGAFSRVRACRRSSFRSSSNFTCKGASRTTALSSSTRSIRSIRRPRTVRKA
jgi:aryl-alcohol dehydrogenase